MPDYAFQIKNLKKVLNSLNSPHLSLPVVAVAGTNGKGSTSNFINNILLRHNKKVGLYTSPHIFNFRERIKIDGQPVSLNGFKKGLKKVRRGEKKVGVKLTKFEIITAVAIVLFSELKCDIAVMEAGLGGRLDATNVCKNKKVSVITPISKEHSEYLGNSIKKIALEKAGIIKEGVPVVDFSNTAAIRKEAHRLKSPVYSEGVEYRVKDMRKSGTGNYKFSYLSEGQKIKNVVSGLKGKFQVHNAAAAVRACYTIGCKNKKKLKTALRKTGLPGRLEVFKKAGRCILVDAAHNPAAVKGVMEFIRENKPSGSDLYLIMGVYKDKDYSKMLKRLSPKIKRALVFTPENDRALKGEKLAALLKEKGEVKESFKECYEKMLGIAKKESWIIICGSFSVVKPALKLLKQNSND
ncbi:MAG: bifunctional folylpolyglutamate synthase/dihydrofolate synthase [Elusimicrobiota bacterium]